MRLALAEKLLAKIMNWDTEIIKLEQPKLRVIANLKYDDYQQFEPGIRFIESLVRWLQQFEQLEERRIAYDHFITRLIFFSDDEISHLMTLAFSEYVEPTILDKIAVQTRIDKFHKHKLKESNYYQEYQRLSLFVGLSDGSRIDQFRRMNFLNNEQVCQTYQIPDEKAKELLKKLREDLRNTNNSGTKTPKFTSLFLLDDFSASGISYCRIEEGAEDGKLFKVLNAIYVDSSKSENRYTLGTILNKDNLDIHVIFYIATFRAIEKIRSSVKSWIKRNNKNLKFSVNAIQILDDTLKQNTLQNQHFMKIIEKYFDTSIVDEHFKKGKTEKPHLGYDECGIPVVLNHNTPNNSLPIYWMGEDKKIRGLFPRITRHRS